MEEVIEEVSLFDNNEQPEKQQAVEEAKPEVKEEAPSFDMPEKFKGKALEEVIESYVNLEKEYGSKANEVGELRKLTDQILQNQVAAQPQSALAEQVGEQHVNELGFDDFVDDPVQAIDQALASNPRLQKMEQALEHREHEIARSALLAKHEDADDVVSSPAFQKWVMEAEGRQKMLRTAHVENDAALAGDLIDVFKATQVAATETAIDERDAIAASDLKKASVETGSVPAQTKPMFRRKELIQLKIRDPQRYEAMSDEIKQAYADGRVK